mgnify:CR=1 FL=1
MSDKLSILVEQKSLISCFQWEEILRDIIMFSDTVWLHRSAVAFDNTSLDPSIQRHLEWVYNELIDANIIQFYSFESDSDKECQDATRVITHEEHLDLYNLIIEKIQNPNTYTTDSLPDPERTSRIVERRNELWKYGLATLLDAQISLSCENPRIPIPSEIDKRALNHKLASELFSAFDITTLSHLNAKELLDLKKVSEGHRKILTDLTTQAQINPNTNISDLVAKELNDSITKINEMASNVAGNGAIKSLIANTALNFAGLIPFTYAILIPLTAVLCGKDLFEFFRSRKKYGFVLFMNSLKTKSNSQKLLPKP